MGQQQRHGGPAGDPAGDDRQQDTDHELVTGGHELSDEVLGDASVDQPTDDGAEDEGAGRRGATPNPSEIAP